MGLFRGWVEAHLAALTFNDARNTFSLRVIAATLALHLIGLAAAAYLLQLPTWFALPALTLVSIVPALMRRARGRFALDTLAPLFFLYAIIAARFVYIRVFGGDVPGYFDYNAPDLRSSLFRLEPWTICAFIYTLAIQVRYLADRAWQRISHMGALVLALTAFVWAGALYIGQRTHGVTGTDPYAYAQMGVDLALRGTPLHRFTLFESVAPLNIAWSPIVHLGYHIPINASGDAPTVWPIGGSFAFAVAYRLAGEPGLYLVNPLASLLLLVAIGWLAWELFRDSRDRAWLAALSIAILATSHTLFDWATVPMVDAQAALFSVLAIGLAMRFARQPRLVFATMCGLALGAAYFVRHTQLLIVPAICVLLWMNRAPRGLRVRALVIAGVAALLVALPDLWYHQVVFGGWLTPESRELNLFSLAAIAETAIAFNTGLLAAREFGWLLPFLLYGTYRLARAQRVEFVALALWALVLIGFHLLYPALRLRDLLPEFPPLAIVAAYGVVALLRALWRRFVISSEARNLIAAAGFIATLFLLLMRVWNVLPIPFGAPQYSYGYLTAAQRAAFDQLAALTPPNAVIGASLNTGALDLYARRATFIPDAWSPQEQGIFLATMMREGKPIFLLDDSAGMTIARHQLEARYTLRLVAALDVPTGSVL
ncbi:MAG: glycosyltransferase family 39 protein, partial [Chloroflexota bacterium]